VKTVTISEHVSGCKAAVAAVHQHLLSFYPGVSISSCILARPMGRCCGAPQWAPASSPARLTGLETNPPHMCRTTPALASSKGPVLALWACDSNIRAVAAVCWQPEQALYIQASHNTLVCTSRRQRHPTAFPAVCAPVHCFQRDAAILCSEPGQSRPTHHTPYTTHTPACAPHHALETATKAVRRAPATHHILHHHRLALRSRVMMNRSMRRQPSV
jgi:hypothetical protein